MADNVYEGMFILDANRYGRDPETVSGQIPEMIKNAGGEVLVSRLWEERRLAYPIQGHRKGAYWLTYFRIDGEKLSELERKCQLADTILRVLFLKVDPRITDALISHAKSGHAPGKSGEERPKAPEEKAPSDDGVTAAVDNEDNDESSATGEEEEN